MERVFLKTPRYSWILLPDKNPFDKGCESRLSICETVLAILSRRGLGSEEEVRRFLYPEASHLHSAWQLKGMKEAVERILCAAKNTETVLVHGDYDADGITGSAIIIKVLERLKCKVVHHIPDRFTEDYGLSLEGIKKGLSQGTSLLITVDCGTNSHRGIEFALESGMDVIVTDHHRPLSSFFPEGVVVINPKQKNCGYPDKDISGSGVALKLAMGLIERSGARIQLGSLLRMACIGTIADLVPLKDENRIIAKLGLRELSAPRSPGLKAILEISDMTGKESTARDVSFRIAPRLNAAGRMAHAESALELFLTSSDREAALIARKLDAENRQRQVEQEKIIEEALTEVESKGYIDSGPVLVLAAEGWHQGVVGIVAAKLKEKFYRPAVVLSVEGQVGKGSARSIEGYDITEALGGCKDLLLEYGGHSQAAGLKLRRDQIPKFREKINLEAGKILNESLLTPSLRIDAEVDPQEMDVEFLGQIELLSPFGLGNPKPVFLFRSARILGEPAVLKEKHVRFSISARSGGRIFRAIYFNGTSYIKELLASKDHIHIACEPTLNTFRGTSTVEFVVKDFAAA